MKRIVFTKHGRKRIMQRGLTEKQARQLIREGKHGRELGRVWDGFNTIYTNGDWKFIVCERWKVIEVITAYRMIQR